MVTPFINAEAGEARNSAVPASSSGSAQSPAGRRAITLLKNSGLVRPPSLISVLIQPGAIAFTRMPSAANPIASDFVSDMTAVLAAAYAGTCGAPKYAYFDAMFMMQPLEAPR